MREGDDDARPPRTARPTVPASMRGYARGREEREQRQHERQVTERPAKQAQRIHKVSFLYRRPAQASPFQGGHKGRERQPSRAFTPRAQWRTRRCLGASLVSAPAQELTCPRHHHVSTSGIAKPTSASAWRRRGIARGAVIAITGTWAVRCSSYTRSPRIARIRPVGRAPTTIASTWRVDATPPIACAGRPQISCCMK